MSALNEGGFADSRRQTQTQESPAMAGTASEKPEATNQFSIVKSDDSSLHRVAKRGQQATDK